MARYQYSSIEGGTIRGYIDYNAGNRRINSVIVERDDLSTRPIFIARDPATDTIVYQEQVPVGAPSPLVRNVPGNRQMVLDEGVLVPPFNLELVS